VVGDMGSDNRSRRGPVGARRCRGGWASDLTPTGDTVWEGQVQGRASDLEHLVRNFTAPPLLFVRDERDGCRLRSDSFAACTTPHDVLEDAEQVLSILSGVLRLTRDSHEGLRVGAVFRRRDDESRDVVLHVQDTLKVRAELGEPTVTITDSDGIVRVAAPPRRPLEIARLGLADETVAKALRLLANATDWVGLYRLYEVMEEDIGGERKLVRRPWCPAARLKRFKQSANSPTVAGDTARHGTEPGDPPRDPMSLDEARAFVHELVEGWFGSKGV